MKPGWIAGGFLSGWALALFWRELRRPLRPRTVEPKLRHSARNVALAALAGAVALPVGSTVLMPLAELAESRGWGLLAVLNLPGPAAAAVGVVLLDYAYYVWHVLTHKVPLLWRFHRVHHADLDLDASTALRFHFGEILLSVPYVALLVVGIGPTTSGFRLWQFFFAASVLFHHSNTEMPRALERVVERLVMTPRRHGIHHSIEPAELNSNWSSGLILWDRLHGTLNPGLPGCEVTVGVAGCLDPERVRLSGVLLMPFVGRADPPPGGAQVNP